MECLANPVSSPLFYCKSNMILLQPRILGENKSARQLVRTAAGRVNT